MSSHSLKSAPFGTVQNLALALVSVVFATLPTLAGVFPLWLAVLLHEGATVLVGASLRRGLRGTHLRASHFKTLLQGFALAVGSSFQVKASTKCPACSSELKGKHQGVHRS